MSSIKEIKSKTTAELNEGLHLISESITSIDKLLETLSVSDDLYPMSLTLKNVTKGLEAFIKEVIRLRGVIDEDDL